jgi:hypothetical protein
MQMKIWSPAGETYDWVTGWVKIYRILALLLRICRERRRVRKIKDKEAQEKKLKEKKKNKTQ